jgi:hypothetical protein
MAKRKNERFICLPIEKIRQRHLDYLNVSILEARRLAENGKWHRHYGMNYLINQLREGDTSLEYLLKHIVYTRRK